MSFPNSGFFSTIRTTNIVSRENVLPSIVRISEKFPSKPRGVIQNWKKGGDSLNKIAHCIKEHTRLFKNTGIGLRKDKYEYRYQIGYWHPDIHMEENRYIQKYSIKRLRYS